MVIRSYGYWHCPYVKRKMQQLSLQEQVDLIKRGTAEIIPEEDLIKKLELSQRESRPLRVKLGLDPTAPDIHLGIAVVLRKLRQFQDLGHEVFVIIGDFTATIGDPSGKSETRKQLSAEEVSLNARTYEEQYCKILDPEKTRVVFNNQWLGKLNFAEVIQLTAKTTIARVLERDDFANRLARGQSIGVHEILYPICQGYDSVVLKADIEMGGSDQKFNILMGRDLQRAYGQEPQVALLMPLLVGTDGVQKMSKSLGNYVGINEPPDQIYGKLMSIPDELIVPYFELATEVTMFEVRQVKKGLKEQTLHPKKVKQSLAREVVAIYYDKAAAERAEAEFERVFKEKELPTEIPEVIISQTDFKDGKVWVIRLLTQVKFAASNREARTLIEQGGVSLNGEKITDSNLDTSLEDGAVLRVGRRWARIKIANSQ